MNVGRQISRQSCLEQIGHGEGWFSSGPEQHHFVRSKTTTLSSRVACRQSTVEDIDCGCGNRLKEHNSRVAFRGAHDPVLRDSVSGSRGDRRTGSQRRDLAEVLSWTARMNICLPIGFHGEQR